MVETRLANGARGEVTLDLGGETYVLRPEFGVIARIEEALDSSLLKLVGKAELLDLKAEELVHTLKAVLAANGHEVEEETLANAIAEQGVATVMVPLLVFLRGYLWGGRAEKAEKKDKAKRQKPAAKPRKTGTGRATSSASA